jgi:hypothetical protein
MRKPEHVRQNIAASDAGPLDKTLLAELKKHRWDRRRSGGQTKNGSLAQPRAHKGAPMRQRCFYDCWY